MVVGRWCPFLSGSLIFSGLASGMVLHSNSKRGPGNYIFSSMLQNEQQRSNSPSKKVQVHCFIASILLFFFIHSPKPKNQDVSIIRKNHWWSVLLVGTSTNLKILAHWNKKTSLIHPANIRTTFSRSGAWFSPHPIIDHGGGNNFIIFSSF